MSPQNIQFQQKAWQLGSSNQAATFVAISGIFLGMGAAVNEKKVPFYCLPTTKKPYTYAIDNYSELLVFDAKPI